MRTEKGWKAAGRGRRRGHGRKPRAFCSIQEERESRRKQCVETQLLRVFWD